MSLTTHFWVTILLWKRVNEYYYTASTISTGFESQPCRIFVIGVVLCTIINPWSHSKSVGRGPEFGLPSVALLPCSCRKLREAIFTHLHLPLHSKHKTSTQCWINVGPASKTVDQHWSNIEWTSSRLLLYDRLWDFRPCLIGSHRASLL